MIVRPARHPTKHSLRPVRSLRSFDQLDDADRLVQRRTFSPNPDITGPSEGPYDRDNPVVSALPGAVLRLLETDASTRLLANPQLRVSEGQTAQARFGDQVPVPGTTFTAIATAQEPLRSLIRDEVMVDTKKLYSNAEFESSIEDVKP